MLFSSESESEDECQLEKRPRVLKERINFDGLHDITFNEKFRVNKIQFEYIYSQIGMHFLHRSRKNQALSPEQQMLSALHWLGSGSQYHTVGDMHGISKSTVCRNVQKFSRIVVDKLFPRIVNWPENINDVPMQFFLKAGFPCVAGCVDGTLINIDANKLHEKAYVDRYGNHSLNSMLVCGPDMSFYYVNARFPGSVNDARVMRASELYRRMESGWRPFPGAVLLGDSAYALKDWLIPNVLGNLSDLREHRMYKAHTSTRRLIECAYGLVKEKFPCLNHLRVCPETAACIIMTCATLQNVIRMYPSTAEEEYHLPDDNEEYNIQNVNTDLNIEVVTGQNRKHQLLDFFN